MEFLSDLIGTNYSYRNNLMAFCGPVLLTSLTMILVKGHLFFIDD